MLGPGLLIAIPYVLALLFTLFTLVVAIGNEDVRSGNRDITILVVLFGLLSLHYVASIGGAVGMIMRAPRWLSITTCIVAMLPTMFISTFCFGLLLYPVALGGSIWGLISLFGSSSSRSGYAGAGYAGAGAGPQPPYKYGGATTASTDYLRQAQREAAEKSAPKEWARSPATAILCIVGGIGCIAFALFAAYSYYRYMNGEVELRRPTRAISGAVIATITGIGLLMQGIAFFNKSSDRA